MRTTKTWTAGIVLASALAGGAGTAFAVGPAGPAAVTAATPNRPVLVGYYGTGEECYEAGSALVGEHACAFAGARGWALYVFD
ncbi:hypothetical protein [Streptomyces sp. NPDC090022]|uniref:hypothetical protein n=1 Tax=Streptomyces sp. NPDC090022 TaxID=3365920 RepID=UPI00381AC601